MKQDDIEKKCIAILHSDLSDALKIELIGRLKEPKTTVYYPTPIYLQPPQKLNWWDQVTCTPNTGSPVIPETTVTSNGENFNPSREAWERAQADNVMNQRVFYGKQEVKC